MRSALLFAIIFLSATKTFTQQFTATVIPSSIRIDPVTNEIIENRFVVNKGGYPSDLLKKNWIYNGSKVSLKAARGEYVSNGEKAEEEVEE